MAGGKHRHQAEPDLPRFQLEVYWLPLLIDGLQGLLLVGGPRGTAAWIVLSFL